MKLSFRRADDLLYVKVTRLRLPVASISRRYSLSPHLVIAMTLSDLARIGSIRSLDMPGVLSHRKAG